MLPQITDVFILSNWHDFGKSLFQLIISSCLAKFSTQIFAENAFYAQNVDSVNLQCAQEECVPSYLLILKWSYIPLIFHRASKFQQHFCYSCVIMLIRINFSRTRVNLESCRKQRLSKGEQTLKGMNFGTCKLLLNFGVLELRPYFVILRTLGLGNREFAVTGQLSTQFLLVFYSNCIILMYLQCRRPNR